MAQRKAIHAVYVQCRDCGFLYGVVPEGHTRRDVYFDPDGLRGAVTIEDRDHDGFNVTTRMYQTKHRKHEPVSRSNPLGGSPLIDHESYDEVSTRNYIWSDCQLIGCYRGVWNIDRGIPTNNNRAKWIEAVYEERSCSFFFPYKPGLSVDDHIYDQREERRLEREEALQERLTKQTTGIQWAAIIISGMSLIISILIPLMLNPVEKITIVDPVPVIVKEPTTTPSPTTAPTRAPTATPSTSTP